MVGVALLATAVAASMLVSIGKALSLLVLRFSVCIGFVHACVLQAVQMVPKLLVSMGGGCLVGRSEVKG